MWSCDVKSDSSYRFGGFSEVKSLAIAIFVLWRNFGDRDWLDAFVFGCALSQ